MIIVSESDATSTHGPIHTGTSPQFSGALRHSQTDERAANQRSHRSARWGRSGRGKRVTSGGLDRGVNGLARGTAIPWQTVLAGGGWRDGQGRLADRVGDGQVSGLLP
jgi:hypothetical protein